MHVVVARRPAEAMPRRFYRWYIGALGTGSFTPYAEKDLGDRVYRELRELHSLSSQFMQHSSVKTRSNLRAWGLGAYA